MKLFHLVLRRISLALILILSLWAVFFYMAVMAEVNDEVDDSLEDYAEILILRALSGEELPTKNSGSNNQFYLYEVSEEYALSCPHISYRDEMVYITDKGEEEPARVLMYIFQKENGQYMELVVYTPTIEKADLLKAIMGWIVFLYALLLLMIIFLNAWVFRKNMKPLYKLLDWLDRYRLGHANEPLDNPTRIYEFARLNESLRSSVERSEQQFEQQKLFIGNASHEMQTPLAICKNRLEMLMEDDRLTEYQMGELMKTYHTLENLSRMNKSLLLLCKIDNGQFADIRLVSLNEVLGRYVNDYQEVYAYKKISVDISEEGVFEAMLSDALSVVLVTNLLKNAFVHTRPSGRIHVCISAREFCIANTGEQALDTEHLFERFYQVKRKEGSTGLGLALVDSVCKAHRLRIRYNYEEGMHKFCVFQE